MFAASHPKYYVMITAGKAQFGANRLRGRNVITPLMSSLMMIIVRVEQAFHHMNVFRSRPPNNSNRKDGATAVLG